MGKVKQILINRYDGGIAFDTRNAAASQYSTSLNFDIFKKPSTLSPIRGIESDQAYSGAGGFKAYKAAAFGGSFAGGIVYAWARKTTSDTGVKLWEKSPTDANWAPSQFLISDVSTDIEATSGCPVPGAQIVWNSDTSGGLMGWSIVNSADSLTSGSRRLVLLSQKAGVSSSLSKKVLASNPTYEPKLILGQDGNVYVSSGRSLHRCNTDGTVTDDVLQFSASFTITSMCTFGFYLVLLIKGFASSRLVLWDYKESQVSESVDLGEGTAFAVENLNGTLIIVMDKFVNTTFNGLGTSNGQGVMQIKAWGGGQSVVTITEFKAGGVLAGATKNYHFRKNNGMYWYAKIPLDATPSTYAEGIWSFGRITSSQPYALSLHREVPANFVSFHMQGDYTYLAHGTDGSVSRTHNDDTYDLTSTYESAIFDDNNPTQEKQFVEARLGFEKLTSGQTVTLKYRKDGATTWTTVSPVPAIATGDVSADYPMEGNFREMQFRIESTGGAKINTLKMVYEELDS